ncbi:MAG: hypothetical protein ACFFCY_02610 [Promethearchaeota archaeon]
MLVFSIIGLAIARTQDFNDFTGEGHASCHGNITQSATGYVTLSSSSGLSVTPNENFVVSIQVLSFSEAQGNNIVAGFPSGNPGLGDNKDFTFDTTQKSVSIGSSGDSTVINFQVTAPSIAQTYTLHADAIYRAGGSASYFAHGDLVLTVQVENTPPQFSNLIESSDPLEFGQQETFQVDVTDSETSVSVVLIELAGQNYTMTNILSNTFEYNWNPSTTGVKNYIIYASDTDGSWNSITGNILVTDTTAPNLSNLVESADPLELGQTETIQINVTDLSAINSVLIEISSMNYTMANIGGSIWEYNDWTPISTGIKPYVIYVNDAEGNGNSLSNSITVQDTVQPSLTNLIESADPLELGQTEVIQINVTDLSGISNVFIELGGINYTMINTGGIRYEYNSWTPLSVGVKGYTIYVNDTEGNWNSLSNSITVQDTTAPFLFNLIENADPLELGQTEIIQINVTDLSGITQVLIQINNVNYTMTKIGSSTWEYNNWIPLTTGLKSYYIYAKDGINNWNSMNGNINVIDTTVPVLSNLVESADPLELGQTETIQVNVTDLSGINQVLLEINSVNYTMINIGSSIWEYNSWTPTSTGTKLYTVYASDTEGNWNSITNSINVEDTIAPTYNFLIESADPLPLGQNETISIEVYDSPGSGVKDVFLEYDNSNHTMNFKGLHKWEWSNWKPISVGIFDYTIYMIDNSNNLNTTIGSIEVFISSGPSIQNLSKSADPLELGQSETIQVDVNDSDGVSKVLIELGISNYTMVNIGGKRYEYTWQPNTVGTKLFKIYANDSFNNWNLISESILVIDTTPPNFGNLTESYDPLEFGKSVLISIDATDLSGINQVKIEFEGTNHSMSYIGGNTWLNDTWVPSTVNTHLYTIYIQDKSNNWNFTNGSIEVIDTTAPILSNLYESTDPLELGQTEIIRIDVIDLAPISSVYIEIEGINYTMSKINSITWEYNNWNPTSTGIKFYTIYANDTSNNIISLIANISIVDTIGPTLSNLIESADPLELGQTETIQINVSDLSGINQVLIEIDSVNNTMINIGGSVWEYNNWIPANIGLESYTIYSSDNEGNWNSLTSNINVVDTNGPTLSNLFESADPLELGQTETIQIHVTDLSAINKVLIEISGMNYTMANIGGSIWEYNGWNPISTGVKSYKIYAIDTEGNGNSLSNSITVQDTVQPSLNNLVESVDPLELGQTETIQVNVTDLSGISQVLIETDSVNYTMINIGGSTWEYNWIPNSVGLKLYTIFGEDTNNNWHYIEGNITVLDTNAPTLSNLIENTDPLELGNTASFQVDIFDFSPINLVLFEHNGNNYSMTNYGGLTWHFNWTLSNVGLKFYRLHAIDSQNNKISLKNNITVIDTKGPIFSNLVISDKTITIGQSISIQVEIIDFSNVSDVIIEYEGSNHSMINIFGNTWEVNNWIPNSLGDISVIIYANDTHNNWNMIYDNIIVNEQSKSNNIITIEQIIDFSLYFSIISIIIAGIVIIIKTSRTKRFIK